jgi:hypothetical protein
MAAFDQEGGKAHCSAAALPADPGRRRQGQWHQGKPAAYCAALPVLRYPLSLFMASLQIKKTDVKASNGVLHSIEGVLIPK